MPASTPFFATPEDAEAAFYDALERGDLEAMMGVWADDEELMCVHPGGPRLVGRYLVREAWRQIFEHPREMHVRVAGQILHKGLMLAVSHVLEQIISGAKAYPPVAATNVYRQGSGGWRMVCHHASPHPAQPDLPDDTPSVLH